ncbi:MAG: RluA family pseudouridine synthase [Candidatus Binatia bacterium]
MSAARHVTLAVPETADGVRLDRFLGGVRELGSRSQAKQLVERGCVRVEGVVRKPGHVLRTGMRVDVEVPASEPSTLEPEALPLTVLYEDAELLVIDKPPGMVVHPAPGSRRGTVAAAVLHRLGQLVGVGDPERPGIVHRLDKNTSGVLVVARSPGALAALARQFHDREVHKRYVAVVHGRVRADRGLIDQPIGRHPHERKRMSVHSRRGRAAVTRFVVRERLTGATVLDLFPETGRTHQLRVHLAALGHPVVGDPVYGARRTGRAGTPPGACCPRQALHAAEIRFRHPTRGEDIVVRAPLPPDIVALIAEFRGKTP